MRDRSLGWCWTINNPTEDDDECIKKAIEDCAYLVYGKETGEEGTLHYQGYLWYKTNVRFGRIKRLLPRAHIEKQRGSNEQAIEYCKKDNDWYEWGIKPQTRDQKKKWKDIVELSECGNEEEIRAIYPDVYFRHIAKIRSMKKYDVHILSGDLQHEWWFGATGTGKSKKLWSDYPNHYSKKKNKWWDNYQGEEIVAIEEWSPTFHMLASELKIWCDRYPFPAEIKGGSLKAIRPTKLIILSNYSIDQCFPNSEDSMPLKRRFKTVEFFNFFTEEAPPLLNGIID